jgi:phosphate-selective porin O/P
MTFSIRRALGVAVVAAAAGAAPLAAQASQTPQVTVGGVVYTQYVYQLKDTVNHLNSFDITRAYINVLGRFSGGVTTRVTGDIYRNADGSLGYRLKYAFATYTPQGSQLTFKVGQIHTPWIDWEEALWDYRMQGQMAMERAGYVSASDFGVGVDGKWGPDKVNLQLTVVNGEFYRSPEADQGKDAMARLSVRLLDTDDSSRVGGLRVTGYAGYGRAAGGAERNRYLGMVSYRSKHLTLAGEAAAAQTGPLGAINGHAYSAFGVYRVPDSKVAIIGRVDITHLQAGATDKQTRFIGGVSYQLTPNWRLLGDWDYANYQTDALNAANDATRSQALFQTQFTF